MKTSDTTHSEVLGATLKPFQAQAIERDAKKHLAGFTSSGFALAVDLRKLQDGGAHLLRGKSNFGEYIEDKFKGQISAENAKKLSLQGKVIIALVDAKKVTLAPGGHGAVHKLLGVTGARALSAVQSKHGEPAMLSVFDTAAEIVKENGTVITDETVKAILQPQLTEPAPRPEPKEEPAPEVEPEDAPELSAAECDLLEIVAAVEEDCIKLTDIVENGGTGTDKAKAYTTAIIEEATKLTAALTEALAAAKGTS